MNPILTYIICKKCKEERPYHREKCRCGETEVLKRKSYTEVIGW